MGMIHGLQLDTWGVFCQSARRLRQTEAEEEEVEALEEELEESEELEDREYELSEESGEELGPDVEEELELEVREDTPPLPELVFESGLEDWDLTLRM